MVKNYIGITGFKSIKEIEAINEITNHKHNRFMYGIITSTKRIQNPNKEGRVSPKFKNIRNLLNKCENQNIFAALHYYTSNQEKHLEKDIDILSQFETNLKGVQWNIEWPNPQIIKKLNLEHIIQLKKHILEGSFDEIKYKIDKYANTFQNKLHILIDPSGGKGQEIELNKYKNVIQYLANNNLNWGIAGGLSPKNVTGKLNQTINIAKTKKFSTDIESKVRTNNQLDMLKCKEYLINTTNVLN